MSSELHEMFALLKNKINITNETFKEVKKLMDELDAWLALERVKLDKQRHELDEHQAKLNKLKKLMNEFSSNMSSEATDHFDPSSILTSASKKHLIELCQFPVEQKWRLCYRASLHGFSSRDFHAKCDGIRQTLTIVRTTRSFIFGGYAEEAWSQSGEYIHDDKAFVFSLVNRSNRPIMIRCSAPDCAFTSHSNAGPTFGEGHAFYISDNSNNNETKLLSCTNLGLSYKHPDFTYNSHEAKTVSMNNLILNIQVIFF